MQDSLTANLYRLIKHMRMKDKKEKTSNSSSVPKSGTATDTKKAVMSEKFPFLAIPDNPEVQQL